MTDEIFESHTVMQLRAEVDALRAEVMRLRLKQEGGPWGTQCAGCAAPMVVKSATCGVCTQANLREVVALAQRVDCVCCGETMGVTVDAAGVVALHVLDLREFGR